MFKQMLVRTAPKIVNLLPLGVKNVLRKVVPLQVKRALGKKLLSSVVTSADDIIEVSDGRKFNVIEDRLFLRVYLDKNYEPDLTDVARKLINLNDTVVDVGANFGWYTTLFSQQVGEGGNVISYEPLKRSRDILKSNIELNSNAEVTAVWPHCVGDTAGSVTMMQGESSESGLAHVVTEKSENTIEVSVVRLDEQHSESKGKIAYLKMDIEGYEYYALQGALDLLDCDDQPILQLEMNDEALERSGSNRGEVLTYLESLGYKFYEPIPGSTKIRLSDRSTCSDIFCFGKGKFANRINVVL